MELRIVPVKNDKIDIIIEGARVIYKNFAGAAKKYNAKGDRNFNLAFNSPEDDAIVEQLVQMGWNVKKHEPKDPADAPWYTAKIKVRYHDEERFQYLDPTATLILGKKQTILSEETIDCLDNINFVSADVRISCNPFVMDDGSTVQTLYLKQLFVTGEEDYLTNKYSDYSAPDAEDSPFAD